MVTMDEQDFLIEKKSINNIKQAVVLLAISFGFYILFAIFNITILPGIFPVEPLFANIQHNSSEFFVVKLCLGLGLEVLFFTALVLGSAGTLGLRSKQNKWFKNKFSKVFTLFLFSMILKLVFVIVLAIIVATRESNNVIYWYSESQMTTFGKISFSFLVVFFFAIPISEAIIYSFVLNKLSISLRNRGLKDDIKTRRIISPIVSLPIIICWLYSMIWMLVEVLSLGVEKNYVNVYFIVFFIFPTLFGICMVTAFIELSLMLKPVKAIMETE